MSFFYFLFFKSVFDRNWNRTGETAPPQIPQTDYVRGRADILQKPLFLDLGNLQDHGELNKQKPNLGCDITFCKSTLKTLQLW